MPRIIIVMVFVIASACSTDKTPLTGRLIDGEPERDGGHGDFIHQLMTDDEDAGTDGGAAGSAAPDDGEELDGGVEPVDAIEPITDAGVVPDGAASPEVDAGALDMPDADTVQPLITCDLCEPGDCDEDHLCYIFEDEPRCLPLSHTNPQGGYRCSDYGMTGYSTPNGINYCRPTRGGCAGWLLLYPEGL